MAREFNQPLCDALTADYRQLLARQHGQKQGHEAIAAMATALHETLANHGANDCIPHFESADALLRVIRQLLVAPYDEPYVSDKMEQALKTMRNEFKLSPEQDDEPLESPTRGLGKEIPGFPHLRLVMMDQHLVPARA